MTLLYKDCFVLQAVSHTKVLCLPSFRICCPLFSLLDFMVWSFEHCHVICCFFILAVHSYFISFLFVFFFGFENFCDFGFVDYCFSSCNFFQNSIELMIIEMTITVKMDEINCCCFLKKNPVPNPNENHLRTRQIALLDTFLRLEFKVWTIEQKYISEFISVVFFHKQNEEVLCVYLQSRHPLTEKKIITSRISSNLPFSLLCKFCKYQL